MKIGIWEGTCYENSVVNNKIQLVRYDSKVVD